jgi:thiamine biosynthesis lipoprotein
MPTHPALSRRARPLLGTLVDVGADVDAFEAAFDAVLRVQRCMSRFEAQSDVARFNAMTAGEAIKVDAATAQVLEAARRLQRQTGGGFDITLGTGAHGWACEGTTLRKTEPGTCLDLAGIAKGYAVDRAVEALQAAGATRGWVNAGGDLRVFGDLEAPVHLRDEAHGGTQSFGRLADGAMATSHFDAHSRSTHLLRVKAHVTVIAPQCLWADALTKVVAAGHDDPALLACYEARAWRH